MLNKPLKVTNGFSKNYISTQNKYSHNFRKWNTFVTAMKPEDFGFQDCIGFKLCQ